MTVVKNARWIIAESDPMKQVEIVYDDIDCKYASSTPAFVTSSRST